MKKMSELFLDLNDWQRNLVLFKMLKIIVRRSPDSREHLRQLSDFMRNIQPLGITQAKVAMEELETLDGSPHNSSAVDPR